jgi:hypothetical protein
MKLRDRSLLHVLFVGGAMALASASMTALPLDSIAFAKNGGGNGGGKGGGNGADHGGGKGGGQGGSNKAESNGSKGAQGSGQQSADSDETDPDIAPNALGKLNGFFHASVTGLNNASPNSAPGSISQTFRELLNEYVDQQAAPPEDGEDTEVDLDDLAEVLAGASNKPMTAGIVDKILDRLSDVYNDDYSSVTDPAEAEGENTGDTPEDTEGEPEPSFSEKLAERVNEINGYETPDAPDEQDPS